MQFHDAARSRQFSPADFADYDSAARALRLAMGVDRLSPRLAAEVRAAVARHAARADNRPDGPLNEPWLARRERLRLDVQAAVSPWLALNYRRAVSSWAGGNTTDRVEISTVPHATGTTSRAWSANGKWSGTNLVRTVHVMPGWRQHVRDVGIAVCDDILTTHAQHVMTSEADGIAVYKASWVRQGRGLDIRTESGLIARHVATGTTCHATGDNAEADTLRTAIKSLRRKLARQSIDADARKSPDRAKAPVLD